MTCTFDVTVSDDEDPVIVNCPTDITETITAGNCSQTVTWTAPTATDNTPGVTLTSTHNPGDAFPIGTTTVTYTATDVDGNTAICTFDVVILPPAQPTLACYETATFNTTTCVWDVTGTQPVEPTTACHETATFNTTTCMWDIAVTDNQDPVISGCPANITQVSDPGVSTAVVTWIAPTATDNCSVSLTSSHNPGDVFSTGTTTVTYTATDGAGNSVTCSFEITILSDCLSNPLLDCDGDGVS
ncbi:HYR domain-containing protein, partial [Brumimicrobium mesophilum]|uniref:HYR domain-containing protein n=1 Tax=Brumimicrobium mesophilum TaxID=392717 RepID=UPI00131E87C8